MPMGYCALSAQGPSQQVKDLFTGRVMKQGWWGSGTLNLDHPLPSKCIFLLLATIISLRGRPHLTGFLGKGHYLGF